MTTDEMKAWIDEAPYKELLRKRRYEPAGSPWFQGDLFHYFERALARASLMLSHRERVAASKAIDRERGE